MDKNKQLLKNTLILAIGMVLPKIFTVLTIPIYSSYLNVEEFGGVDYISTIILGLVVPVITLQLENGVFRYLIDADTIGKKKKYISSSFFIVFPLALISSIIMFFIPVSGLEATNLRVILAIYVAVETLILYFRNLVRGLGNNRQYALNSVIAVVVNFIMLVITMMILKAGVFGYLLSLLIPDVVALIYIFLKERIYQYISIKDVDSVYYHRLLRYSLPLIPNAISWFIINFSDKVIIVTMLGTAAQGIYATAYKIPNMFNMFYQAFSLAWTESAARNADQKGIAIYYSKMFSKLFRVLSGGLGLLLAFSQIAFNILVRGEGYFEAIQYMPILIISTYLSCFAAFYGSIYVGAKASSKAGTTSFASAIVNLIIHFVLIKSIGLYAGVISTFVSFLFLCVYRAYDINKNYYKLRYNYRVMGLVSVYLVISTYLYYQFSIMAQIINIIIALVMAWFINYDLIEILMRKILKK